MLCVLLKEKSCMPDEAVAGGLGAEDVLAELVQHGAHGWSLGRWLGQGLERSLGKQSKLKLQFNSPLASFH